MLIPIILLLVAVIAYLAWKSHQRTVQTWTDVAAELGLHAVVGRGLSRPVLTGEMGGHAVKIDTYTQRSGNSSTTYTRYRMGYPPLGIDLRLKRQGAFAAITRLFGAQDVEVGDSTFDEAFTVKTSNPDRLRSLLTPSVRSGLLRLLASHREAQIADDHILITRSRFERDRDVLKSTVQRMLAVARLLTSPNAGVADDMVVDREQGLLNEVADRVRVLIEEQPDDVDQRLFEVETLAAAGEDNAARERLAELVQLAPADPDVTGWRRALETAPPPERAAVSVDADELAGELFAGDDLSFETLTKFNSRYARAEISWQGQVKSIKETARGPRVAITVATVHNDLYGNTEIDVVVEDPSGKTPAPGATVTISGRLDTIDPLLRNLFLSEAILS